MFRKLIVSIVFLIGLNITVFAQTTITGVANNLEMEKLINFDNTLLPNLQKDLFSSNSPTNCGAIRNASLQTAFVRWDGPEFGSYDVEYSRNGDDFVTEATVQTTEYDHNNYCSDFVDDDNVIYKIIRVSTGSSCTSNAIVIDGCGNQ